jgi:branched-subunit amino acid transport protein
MDKTILLMIIGMGLVTYIPRMIPLVALSQLNLPGFLSKMFLRMFRMQHWVR